MFVKIILADQILLLASGSCGSPCPEPQLPEKQETDHNAAYLDDLVPTAGDDDRVHDVGREADAGDPNCEVESGVEWIDWM